MCSTPEHIVRLALLDSQGLGMQVWRFTRSSGHAEEAFCRRRTI